MNLIDIIRSVNFTFGIGDPTFFGWLTVVAYLGAAGLAAANAWRAETGRSRTPRFSRTECAQPTPPSSEGADTKSVLADWGFDQSSIEALDAAGILT